MFEVFFFFPLGIFRWFSGAVASDGFGNLGAKKTRFWGIELRTDLVGGLMMALGFLTTSSTVPKPTPSGHLLRCFKLKKLQPQ